MVTFSVFTNYVAERLLNQGISQVAKEAIQIGEAYEFLNEAEESVKCDIRERLNGIAGIPSPEKIPVIPFPGKTKNFM